jgi:hypothetical protein
MAFREHNSNILPPLYTNDKTWGSPHTSFVSSRKEQKVRADASKENSTEVPFTQNNGKIEKVYVPNIWKAPNVTKPKTEAKGNHSGSANVVSSQAGARMALPSHDVSAGSSRSDQFTADLLRMETLRPAMSSIHSSTKDESANHTHQPFDRKLVPPPVFTNYVEAVKSNICVKSFGQKATSCLKIFEENSIEQKNIRPYQHVSPKTIQQYGQKLHSLSEKGDRRSAQEAEAILRDMVAKYKAGINAFQPDGGCYNR